MPSAQRPVDIYGGMELLRLLDQFFDRALRFATEGYERDVPQDVARVGRQRKDEHDIDGTQRADDRAVSSVRMISHHS